MEGTSYPSLEGHKASHISEKAEIPQASFDPQRSPSTDTLTESRSEGQGQPVGQKVFSVGGSPSTSVEDDGQIRASKASVPDGLSSGGVALPGACETASKAARKPGSRGSLNRSSTTLAPSSDSLQELPKPINVSNSLQYYRTTTHRILTFQKPAWSVLAFVATIGLILGIEFAWTNLTCILSMAVVAVISINLVYVNLYKTFRMAFQRKPTNPNRQWYKHANVRQREERLEKVIRYCVGFSAFFWTKVLKLLCVKKNRASIAALAGVVVFQQLHLYLSIRNLALTSTILAFSLTPIYEKYKPLLKRQGNAINNAIDGFKHKVFGGLQKLRKRASSSDDAKPE